MSVKGCGLLLPWLPVQPIDDPEHQENQRRYHHVQRVRLHQSENYRPA